MILQQDKIFHYIFWEESNSFLFFGFGNFLFSLNFSMLCFVLFLQLCNFYFVLLVLGLESSFCGLVNFVPFLADNAGQVSDFGGWVLCLDLLIDLSSIEEKC